MKKQLKKLTAVVSAAAVVTVGGIIGLSALAEGDGLQTELDISYGSITISDDSVSGYDSSGNTVKATDPDGYIITGSTTSNTVTVSGTQNITLQNASIDLSGGRFCAFDIGDKGKVTLTLEGENTIKSGKSCAGIDVIEGEALEITGTGSLTVTGGQYGAGIGTEETTSGNLSCGSVVISGGSVWATGGEYGAKVGQGAWYYSSEDAESYYTNGDFYPPKDKDDNSLYPCRIDNPNSDTVLIDGVEFLPKIHSESEKAVHAYLTDDTHYIKVGDKLYYTVLNSDYLVVNEVTVGSAFSITATKDGEALVYGKDYTYPADTGVLTILSDKAVTISGTTTTDTIVVASSVSANITLDGVDIDVSGTPDTCAFKIADNSEGNVTITLADNSENTLISGSGFAGLQKNGDNNSGTLTITGTGTLTATGGDNGAGIGGGNYGNGSYITISGGTVIANGGYNGAGIGGGNDGLLSSNITITGGTVTANCGPNGAGIGGGYGGNAENIIISGGSVKALSNGGGAGIGGGYGGSGSSITISGGSVTALSENGDGIGGGSDGGSGLNITISGGNVDANSSLGRRFTEIPTNGNGKSVYLLTIVGTSLTVDDVEYTTNFGIFRVYLTEGIHTITVDGVTTTKRYVIYQSELTAIGTDLTITADSGSLVYGEDYTYPADTGVLTILSDKAVTISGTTTTDTIFVNSGVSANITLNGVSIDVSSISDTAAFKIEDDSTGNVTITLADGSENTLISGSGCAGLQKNGAYISADKGKLTITGNTGTLTATGGDNGAGIGGGYNASGSNIIISGGSVTAQSSGNGAGIGGGYEGSAENIIISGGTVTATGGDMGAGIGGNNRSGSNIIISGGTVIANGGNGGAGIGGGTGGSGSDITISGGSVTAKSNVGGAGIGGGERGKGSNITISGGTVTATGGWDAAGIGSGNGVNEYSVSGSNITISGGTVTANGGDRGAGIGGGNYASGSNITISGGSVKAVAGSEANAIGGGKDGNGAVTPTNGTSEVYPLIIANPNSADVYVDSTAYLPKVHSAGDANIYAYLTPGAHTVTVGGEATYYMFDNSSNTFVIPDLTITGEGIAYGTDYSYSSNCYHILSDNPITISGSTTKETIMVDSGVSANITLNGVNIDVSGTGDADNETAGSAAFKIADNSEGNVTINLADVSVNTLKGGYNCAGLQKNGAYISADKGKLTITGNTGTLTAVGGDNGAGIGGGESGKGSNITISGGTVIANGGYSGAGIGGGYNGKGSYITISGGKVTASGGYEGAGIGGGSGGGDSSGGSNITISGGTVTATGGSYGAGIGGGYYNSGSYITINGGNVTATGGKYGAGIGGGYNYSGSNITISGGTVIANSGEKGAGIGGGNSGKGSNITISGGTVTATGGKYGAGIGGGNSGGGSNVTISGGSVKAVAGENAKDIGGGYNNGIAVTPTNGTSNVYLLTIANPTGAAVTIDNVQYAVANHSAADAKDTNLYAYLTGADHTVTVGEVTTEYKFYGGKFLPVPTVSDFTFTAPANLKYTGTAKTATVTSDKMGMGEITPKYFNASGDEVTEGADFVPGTYTVKIDVAKGDKYAAETFTKDDWKFTITAGDLTASGAGKASGTFGNKLSELTVSGLTAKLGETEIKGTWALSGSAVPNVGDTKKYTATFTPSENADWYNTLTAEVSLDIAKADAPTIQDIPLSYTWAITGEKTATVSGLPDNMGTIGAAVIDIDDENGIIKDDSAVYGKGELRFTLNGFDSEKKDILATIKVTLPSQNYKDITFSVIVNITEKHDKEAPAESEFEISIDLQSDNTYKATIKTALTGVEYSFDGTTWSSTNTTAVSHGTTVTGYIRYAETLEYKVSEAVSKSATTAHGTLKYHDPKAATCTADGNIEYWTCDSCVKYFTDKNGTTEITAEQIVVEKLEHKWSDKYNFDKDGHWHNCERCGEADKAEAHISGGAATAENAEVCTICGYEIAPKTGQTAAPLFSSNGGTFGSIQKVSITSATEGATIYYTTDGSEPTTESTKYTAAITIDKTTTIKAIAVKDDMENSKVVTAEFTIILPVTTPVISPNGGSFTSSQTVKITCATEGAKIYYTTDGTSPKTSSTFYEKEFTITENTTVRAIAVKEGMTNSAIVSVSFTKSTSSGGGGGSSGGGSSGGGSSGGGSTSSTPTTTNPSIGGSAKSWSDVAADLGKLTNGSEATIELNGSTSVPVDVIKTIADKGSKVTLTVDSVYSWVVDGSKITTPAAADLTITKTASTKSDSLRGIEGTQFKINNTNIPTNLEIAFKSSHSGKFANLYKNVDGKLTFVTCAKLGADGKAILPDVTEKGDYVAMLCEFSDRLGDMDNDGIMNTKDALAVLKDFLGIESGTNPLVSDVNNDGFINSKDALVILKKFLGLA